MTVALEAAKKLAMQNRSTAVMNRRVEPHDSLDFFPTPPWATRALLDEIGNVSGKTALEPAAGEGHMAEVLREAFSNVVAADVHDYGKGYVVGSYTGFGVDVLPTQSPDWVITNPPFKCADEFLGRALDEAAVGVALLVRNAWLEGKERHAKIFAPMPPSFILQFAERVPMVRGRWDPQASSATSYIWVVWLKTWVGATEFRWVRPGAKERHTKSDDALRFAA